MIASPFNKLIGKIKVLSPMTKLLVVVTFIVIGGSIGVVVLSDSREEREPEVPIISAVQEKPEKDAEKDSAQIENDSKSQSTESKGSSGGVETNSRATNDTESNQAMHTTPHTPTGNSSVNPYEAAIANGTSDVITGVCPTKELFDSHYGGLYAVGAVTTPTEPMGTGWKGAAEQMWEFYVARQHIGRSWGPLEMSIFRDGTGISEVLPNTVHVGLSLWHMGAYEWGLIHDLPKEPDTIHSDGSRGGNTEWSIVFGYSLTNKTVSWYIIGRYPAHRWSRSEMSARDIAAMDNLAKNIENYIHELSRNFTVKCPGLL